MGAALDITTDSAKRLAMRHKWPRRPGNDGRALVAVPEERLQEAQAAASDVTGTAPMTTPLSPPVTSPMTPGATPAR